MDAFKAEMNRRVGVGGLRCICCNIYEGKNKSMLRKLARQHLKRQLKKEEICYE